MTRRTSALAFIIVATVIALAWALSGATTHATGYFAVPDPVGDTLGKGRVQHDIILVSGSSAGTNFILTVEFAGPISPPPGPPNGPLSTFGIVGAPDALVGYIDFDTDQDDTTGGGFPVIDAAGVNGGFTSNVTQWCPDPSGMGIEAFLNLGGYDPGAGTAPLVTAGDPVDVPVAFAATSFTATIPLSELGGDKSFNFGMVLGTGLEPTDCAPGDGGFIKPTLYKPTPTPTATSTPTGTPAPTETAPAPTSTVAAAISLPETGGGPSSGTPTPLWTLLGAGALASAAAALWTFRRRDA